MIITISTKDWMVKWQYIIGKISQLIIAEGKEIVIFNIEAERDPKTHFENYKITFETVKNIYEAVGMDAEKVRTTGNFDNIKQILG